MKIKQFILVLLISLISFTGKAKLLSHPIFTSKVYIIFLKSKNLILYIISEYKGFNANAKLVTPQNVTSLIIVDSKSNEKFYKRFDTVDEIITLGIIKDGDILVVAGSGDISIDYSK